METVISNTKVSVREFREMLFDNDDDNYYEIIDGEMIRKSAPTPMHQRISRKVMVIIDRFISEKKTGEIFQSPIDVYLDEYNKPQPDLVFVSESKKAIITNDGIVGVPDLIIEIISPTSIIRDRIEKKALYEKMSVPEFWLIDPQYAAIEIYTLQNNRYELLSAATILEGELKSSLFEGLAINLKDIFSAET
ncbi:MAG TPA: Uma2 family endonuclease [Flavisolibacter sp.]